MRDASSAGSQSWVPSGLGPATEDGQGWEYEDLILVA